MSAAAAPSRIAEFWDQAIVPTLVEYIRVPAKSPHFDAEWRAHGHIDAAVGLAERWCRRYAVPGMKLEVLRLPGRTPLLLLEIPASRPDLETVVVYGHLDKQPEMTGWRAGMGPWTPVIEDGKLYGRGSADDGYAVFCALCALRSLEERRRPDGRWVLLIESCEESGSYDLPAYLDALAPRIGAPGLVIGLDSGCGNYEQLWGTTSLRGLVNGVLTVEVLTEGVHSGDASGVVASSLRVARLLLERIEAADSGVIKPAAFHAPVPPQRSEQAREAARMLGEELWRKFPFVPGMKPMYADLVELVLARTWRAALSVTGADGLPPPASAGNVLRPKTSLVLSLRLPPSVQAEGAAPLASPTSSPRTPSAEQRRRDWINIQLWPIFAGHGARDTEPEAARSGLFRQLAFADHRRRGDGQDQHPRAPRRASRAAAGPGRKNSSAHLYPARRTGDDAPRAAHRRRSAEGSEAPLVGYFPFHRQSPHPPPLQARRARPGLQRARPRRCGRPDGLRAPRARALQGREALSAQGHLPRHLFAPRQHPALARRDAADALPVVRRVGTGAHGIVQGLRGKKACRPGARLRRPAALLARDDGRRGSGARDRRAVRPYPGRRVSGHQRAAGRDPAAAQALGRGPHGGRRRRAGDLLVPRRDAREHPRLCRAVQRRGGGVGGKLPLDAGRARRRECFDREKSSLEEEKRREAALRHGRRRCGAGAVRGDAGSGSARARRAAAAPGGAVSQLASLRRARAGARAAQHPVREIRRLEVPRGGARQGRARRAALGRQPEEPRRRVPGAAAAAGNRAELGRAHLHAL